MYLNDISSGILSTVKLYADDTKVYREISDIARDTSILQSDLFYLRNWSEVWQLNFKAKKCEIMRVTHNRDKSVPHYSLVPHAERLSSVSSVKDLGCGKCLPPGIDSPQMSQRKRNNSRQIILTGPLIGLMAWNHSQRFKLNRSELSRSHNWFTGSTTTTTQRLNLKSQALIVYTEHCMQMAYG